MTFTNAWFTSIAEPVWRVHLPRFDTPRAGLEIGSFEGASACYLLENVLVHPDSRLTVVDTFLGSMEHRRDMVKNLEARFDANVARFGSRIQKIKGRSQVALRTLPLYSYDLIYVDGSHVACDVLEDAVLAWRLLRNGGLLIFDDYEWYGPLPDLQKPKLAIDAFLSIFRLQYNMVFKGAQVIVRKCVD